MVFWVMTGTRWKVGGRRTRTAVRRARASAADRYRIRRPAPVMAGLGGDLGEVVGRHGVQPAAVPLGAPVQRVLERRLHGARDLAGAAAADRVVVDLADRGQLRGRAVAPLSGRP